MKFYRENRIIIIIVVILLFKKAIIVGNFILIVLKFSVGQGVKRRSSNSDKPKLEQKASS